MNLIQPGLCPITWYSLLRSIVHPIIQMDSQFWISWMGGRIWRWTKCILTNEECFIWEPNREHNAGIFLQQIIIAQWQFLLNNAKIKLQFWSMHGEILFSYITDYSVQQHEYDFELCSPVDITRNSRQMIWWCFFFVSYPKL